MNKTTQAILIFLLLMSLCSGFVYLAHHHINIMIAATSIIGLIVILYGVFDYIKRNL